MTHQPQLEELEEKPLDPAVERVRRRMMRLMLVSVGIMLIGLMAVVFGIVYKVSSLDAPRPSAGGMQFDELVNLPASTRILSTQIEGSKLSILTEDETGRQTILLLDTDTGRVTGRFTFSAH